LHVIVVAVMHYTVGAV